MAQSASLSGLGVDLSSRDQQGRGPFCFWRYAMGLCRLSNMKSYLVVPAITLVCFAVQAETVIEAVKAGRVEPITHYLEQGGDVNVSEADGTTLLMWAIEARNSVAAKILIDAGADVSRMNRYGITALYLAARQGDVIATRALLAHGADASGALPEGETVLMTASKNGNPEVLLLLLRGGADVDGTMPIGESPFLYGADPNARESWHQQTALMWAAATGNVDAMKVLIGSGANVDDYTATILAPIVKDEVRQGGFVYADIPPGRLTALHFAAREGRIESVRTLIEVGADLDIGDDFGTNALVLATLNGYLDIAGLLLEAGADPNVADKYGRTVLFMATDLNTLDHNPRPPPRIESELRPVGLVKLALAHDAEVDIPLKDALPKWCAQGCMHNPVLVEGATALLRAAMSGDVEIVRILLEAGADPMVVTSEQERTELDIDYETYPDGQTTPLLAAAGVGWRDLISRGRDNDAIEVIQIFLDLGADINQANQAGHTALHGATYRGSTAIIRFLVDNGADLFAENIRGWTALDIAMGQPDQRIAPNQDTIALLRSLMPVEAKLSSLVN